MEIKFEKGMVAAVEEGADGFEFSIYPDKTCLDIEDSAQRKTTALATFVFPDAKQFYNFFAVNFQMARLIVNKIMDQAEAERGN